MGLRINTNIAAMRAISDYSRAGRAGDVRRARLASGLAVNSGKDSGARLSISEGMRAEIGGLNEGTRNAEQALDLLRTAEGAMGEVSTMLIRMRELAVESSSETMNNRNREAIDAEFNQIKEYIDTTAKATSYNDTHLLSGFGNTVDAAASSALTDSAATGVEYVQLSGAVDGTYRFVDTTADNSITLGNGVVTQTVDLGVTTVGGQVASGTTQVVNFDHLGIEIELAGDGGGDVAGSYADGDLDGKTLIIAAGTGGSFQLGSDAIPADRLEYDIKDLTVGSAVLNLAQISVGTRDSARAAIARVDEAINRLATERGDVGAVMNRLEYTLNFTSNSLERINASESTVRDADFAWETTHLARSQILAQTSTAVLLQSKVPTNLAMSLLDF